MKRVKKIISSLLLASPVAFLSACYGPPPTAYTCHTDDDCSANNVCKIQAEEDYYGNTGGFCDAPAKPSEVAALN